MNIKTEYIDLKKNTHLIIHKVIPEKNTEANRERILEELFYVLSSNKTDCVVDQQCSLSL